MTSERNKQIVLMNPDQFWLEGARACIAGTMTPLIQIQTCRTLSDLKHILQSGGVIGILTSLTGRGESLSDWLTFIEWYATLAPERRPELICLTDFNVAAFPGGQHIRRASSRMRVSELVTSINRMQKSQQGGMTPVKHSGHRQVTVKELQIVDFLAQGLSGAEIAGILGVPAGQIGAYKWRALSLLGMGSIAEYIRLR